MPLILNLWVKPLAPRHRKYNCRSTDYLEQSRDGQFFYKWSREWQFPLRELSAPQSTALWGLRQAIEAITYGERVENTVITPGSLCLLITGRQSKPSVCEATKGSSVWESQKSCSYPSTPFSGEENSIFFSSSSRSWSMKTGTQMKIFYATSKSKQIIRFESEMNKRNIQSWQYKWSDHIIDICFIYSSNKCYLNYPTMF